MKTAKRIFLSIFFIFILAQIDATAQPSTAIKRIRAGTLDRLQRAYKIGVTLAFGSDLVFYSPDETRGTWTISQIDSMVVAGLPNKAIPQAMTCNAARLTGVENQRGAIKPGQFADIVAVAENPLENVSTLKKVGFVMKNGRVFKPAK